VHVNHTMPYQDHLVFSSNKLNYPVTKPTGYDWLDNYSSEYHWQHAVIDILDGLFVHQVYAPPGNSVQLYFIGRSVDKTKDAIAAGEQNPYRHLPRWPWAPVIRERAAWIMYNDLPVPDRTRDIGWAVWVMALVLTGLAIYGGYVRYVLAKGH